MNFLAQAEAGYGSNNILTPWEIHPILTHFPIAFLLGAVALSLFAWWRGRVGLEQVATGLFIAGIIMGVLTALAGFLAFFMLPESHTEAAHRLMYWHLGLQAASLILFAWVAWLRWRAWDVIPSIPTQVIGWIATVVLVVGSALGGYIIYHGGAGIDAKLLKPGLHEEHHEDMEHYNHSEHSGQLSESERHDQTHHAR
jgi:uncharacterized membrane protein